MTIDIHSYSRSVLGDLDGIAAFLVLYFFTFAKFDLSSTKNRSSVMLFLRVSCYFNLVID
jgi:hypothetical protein